MLSSITAMLALAVIQLVDTAAIPPELVRDFTPGEYKGSTDDQNDVFRYRLFEPTPLRSGVRYPLIVWLHGLGSVEMTPDNVGQLRHLLLIVDEPTKPEKYPFYVLAMQLNAPTWFIQHDAEPGLSKTTHEPIDVLAALINQTLAAKPIDANRVYLVGVSGGGTACWEFASRYPNVFAAVAPIASAGADASRAKLLTRIPIWTFHSRYDGITPPSGVRRMVAAVQEAGGVVQLSENQSGAHNVWIEAFQAHHLLDWLLHQRRGSPNRWPPPDSSTGPKSVFTIVLPIAILLLVAIAVAKEFRRRRRFRSASLGLEL